MFVLLFKLCSASFEMMVDLWGTEGNWDAGQVPGKVDVSLLSRTCGTLCSQESAGSGEEPVRVDRSTCGYLPWNCSGCRL